MSALNPEWRPLSNAVGPGRIGAPQNDIIFLLNIQEFITLTIKRKQYQIQFRLSKTVIDPGSLVPRADFKLNKGTPCRNFDQNSDCARPTGK